MVSIPVLVLFYISILRSSYKRATRLPSKTECFMILKMRG